MTSKADFNAEEWTTVVEGPVLAGMRVVAAHRGGTIRESLAVAKVYAAAREAQGDSELLDALVSSPPAVDSQQIRASGGGPVVNAARRKDGAIRKDVRKGPY